MDPIFQDGIETYAKAHSSPEPAYLTKVAEATQAFLLIGDDGRASSRDGS